MTIAFLVEVQRRDNRSYSLRIIDNYWFQHRSAVNS